MQTQGRAGALGEWGDWTHSPERYFAFEVIVEVADCPMYCSRRYGLGGTFSEILVPIAEFAGHSGIGAGFARRTLSTLDALEFFRLARHETEG